MCTTDRFECGDAAALVDELELIRRDEAVLHARRARAIDALARANAAHEESLVIGIEPPAERAALVERSTRAQVACALRVSERAAAALVRASGRLVADLPETLGAIEAGRLSYRHAIAVVDEADSLPADSVPGFERAALSGRCDITAGRFGARCRRIRERLHPESVETRAREAARARSVSIEHARDGMAWLTAYLPVMQAELVHMLLTATAREEQETGDPRTLDQLRADALVDAVLVAGRGPVADGPDALRGQRIAVSITVPALTLLGHGDEPATLDGYGPIPLESAKILAAGATSWRRILTHPVTGVRLRHDRRTYRPPRDLRRWLEDRDATCRFPGCGRRATGCDIDHTVAWEDGGTTDHDNLAHLCRTHHRLKHHSAWQTRFEEDLLVWTDPSGHEYATASVGG